MLKNKSAQTIPIPPAAGKHQLFMPAMSRLFTLGCLLGCLLFLPGCINRNKDVYQGNGFKIKFPAGWTKNTDYDMEGLVFVSDSQASKVTFVTKQMKTFYDSPSMSFITLPEGRITVYANKLSKPIWVSDEFPRLVGSIRKAGYVVKNQGQITIDNQIAHWVLYEDERLQTLNLEFYLVTDFSVFYKLIYSTVREKFRDHRQSFEEARKSFKIGVFSESWFRPK